MVNSKACMGIGTATVALFLLVTTVRADILVSNFTQGSVDKYYDDSNPNQVPFLKQASAAEGVQCVKRSSNEVYAVGGAKPTPIKVYDLTTGVDLKKDINIAGAYRIVALALDASGSVLYAADLIGKIWTVNLPIGSGPCLPNPTLPAVPCQVSTPASFDVVVGPDGNVYATNRGIKSTGVRRFSPVTSTGWSPGNGTIVIPGDTYNGHPLLNAHDL